MEQGAVAAAFAALAGVAGWALWSPGPRPDACAGLRAELGTLPVTRGGRGRHARLTTDPDAPRWVQVDLGAVRVADEIVLFPAEPADPLAAPYFAAPETITSAGLETLTEPSSSWYSMWRA